MDVVGNLQFYVLLALGVAALAVEMFAFVEALRARPDAFEAAGKRTKNFWLLVTGISLAVGFVTLFSVLNLFGLLAVVGAGIFLADVRPAVKAVQGGRGSGGW